ncbi:hypothetical protein D3C86_971660 [compost metagenome]
MWDQTPRLFFVPQAIADARLDASCPAPPLLGRRPADLDRRQSGQAAGRLEPGHARQAAVDHHPHALDGQAGFRHRGRQHYLATAGRRRFDGPVLLALVQRAIEGDDIDLGIAQPFVQPLHRAVDLPLPRQEDQHRSALFAQGQHDGARHGVLESLDGVAAQIEGLDREHPPLGLDHRRAIQELRHPRDVERRRHDQQPQVVAQHRLALARQGQAQIGVQTAFMEFVEQDRADTLQPRVVENHPGEDPLGDDFDARFGADAALQSGAIADRAARLLAQGRRHPVRRRPRRQSARLQHQHLLVAQPRLIQQGQRHDRGLARPRRGGQHDRMGRGQGRFQRLQYGVNRQHQMGSSRNAPVHESVVIASSNRNRVARGPSDG